MIFTTFSEFFQAEAYDHLVSLLQLCLAEDGIDLTSEGIFHAEDQAQAKIVAKQQTLVAGLPVLPLVMDMCLSEQSDKSYTWRALVDEGTEVHSDTVVAEFVAPTRCLLRAERVMLNMLCHLSGVATLTKQYVQALDGTGVRLLDTRKTLPGSRYPDKYAVLVGGGTNHRKNLSEMLMLKDNHIDAAGSISKAVEAVRKHCTPCPPIEVECRNIAEVHEAVACNVERVMLDNMNTATITRALPHIPPTIECEISGGVTLHGIRNLATVVPFGKRRPDFISVGRITHSAPAADFSMRLVPYASEKNA